MMWEKRKRKRKFDSHTAYYTFLESQRGDGPVPALRWNVFLGSNIYGMYNHRV